MVNSLANALLKSDYGHVGMIVRHADDPDSVYYIDALMKVGVKMRNWDDLKQIVGKGKFYDKVAFRHINFNRDHKLVTKLE